MNLLAYAFFFVFVLGLTVGIIIGARYFDLFDPNEEDGKQ